MPSQLLRQWPSEVRHVHEYDAPHTCRKIGRLRHSQVSPAERLAPEIAKFLGTSKVVLTVPNMAAMNRLTVADVRGADIVVVAVTVFRGCHPLGAFDRYS